jgi:hypothetical protein
MAKSEGFNPYDSGVTSGMYSLTGCGFQKASAVPMAWRLFIPPWLQLQVDSPNRKGGVQRSIAIRMTGSSRWPGPAQRRLLRYLMVKGT